MWEDTILKSSVDSEGKVHYPTQEEQAEISYKAGERKVVEFIENNCIGVDTETDDPEDYIGIQSMAWQSFKKEIGE